MLNGQEAPSITPARPTTVITDGSRFDWVPCRRAGSVAFKLLRRILQRVQPSTAVHLSLSARFRAGANSIVMSGLYPSEVTTRSTHDALDIVPHHPPPG